MPSYCNGCDYPLRASGKDWLGAPVLTCDQCGWTSDDTAEPDEASKVGVAQGRAAA